MGPPFGGFATVPDLRGGGIFVAFVVLSILGVGQHDAGDRFQFIVPFFQDNLYQLMVISGVFGALRAVGAVGLLRLRVWGIWLSVINCVVTLVVMVFLLPTGIVEGILSGGALVLILIAYFGAAIVTFPVRSGPESP
ncbi:hypothetical protein [Rathayibacter toxicus]|uniref:hypothetical protein n=1 Tax=Rathayibacter toxicus TaxID=145458 RepID=UPI001C03E8FC|nr:hypothetical protein [Rathayibacter toxicus]QWL33697.1 hypothetical protein E2R36_01225 [Rathayibacter toxicus]